MMLDHRHVDDAVRFCERAQDLPRAQLSATEIERYSTATSLMGNSGTSFLCSVTDPRSGESPVRIVAGAVCDNH